MVDVKQTGLDSSKIRVYFIPTFFSWNAKRKKKTKGEQTRKMIACLLCSFKTWGTPEKFVHSGLEGQDCKHLTPWVHASRDAHLEQWLKTEKGKRSGTRL